MVIQPSAFAAIHANVFGPPPAPMISGMWPAGLGKAQDGPNDTNSPSYDASSWVHSARIASTYSLQDRASLGRGDVVVGELVGVPAEAGADLDPAPGEVVEGRDLLASVIGSDSTGSATAVESLIRERHLRRGRQRDPRVERAGVAVVGQRLVAGPRVGRLALDRDVGVLGHVERVEAPLLRGRGEGGRRGCRGRR